MGHGRFLTPSPIQACSWGFPYRGCSNIRFTMPKKPTVGLCHEPRTTLRAVWDLIFEKPLYRPPFPIGRTLRARLHPWVRPEGATP